MVTESPAFWEYLQGLVDSAEIKIDRPQHSRHPRYPDIIYPFDYGYLAGVNSTDGAELDVWIGAKNARRVTGIVCCVDLEKRDVEMKVLVGCDSAETVQIVTFHNKGSQAATLISRPLPQT